MELNEREIKMIGDLLEVKIIFEDYAKGGRFVGATDVHKYFDRDLRIISKPINVTGVRRDFIKAINHEFVPRDYKKAFEDKEIKAKMIEELLTVEEGEEDIILATKVVSENNANLYRKCFEEGFAMYNAELEQFALIARKSGQKLLAKMSIEGRKFTVEFPFIDRELNCMLNGELYSFAYMPINLKEFSAGIDTELKLQHPYMFLIQECIKTVGNKTFSPEIFRRMVFKANGENIPALQNKIKKTMQNAKEFSWSDKNNCPIMWVDKFKSEVGRMLLEENIQLNLHYDELLLAKGIKGVDLITGSTSAPGKRVRKAVNYMIVRDNGTFTLKRNPKATSPVLDITNNLKKELYPCFSKTSAKRDNTCTIKDTYNLLNPFGYKNRFKVKE